MMKKDHFNQKLLLWPQVSFKSLFYCVVKSHVGKMAYTLWLFHNCFTDLGNMVRFASFSGSLHAITVAQAEQFHLVPGNKLHPQCSFSLYKNKQENNEPMEHSSVQQVQPVKSSPALQGIPLNKFHSTFKNIPVLNSSATLY